MSQGTILSSSLCVLTQNELSILYISYNATKLNIVGIKYWIPFIWIKYYWCVSVSWYRYWFMDTLSYLEKNNHDVSGRVLRMKTLILARVTCVFYNTFKKVTHGLMHKGCVLQRRSLDALSDVTVVLGIRQSIVCYPVLTWYNYNCPPNA